MTRSVKGGRRPVVFWAICPECLTYIWVDGSAIADEIAAACPYCDKPISLQGGSELANSCKQLQGLLEDVERQISLIPAAIDVHRFLFEQVEYIAAAFNDRLDEIQEEKDLDLEPAAGEAKPTS
ncbi:MAG: hypothetical protein WC935_01360 [Thermoleophilia bacterium]